MSLCGSVLLVPDGPGNPDIECRCEVTFAAGHTMHFGHANGARRRWVDAQARRPVLS